MATLVLTAVGTAIGGPIGGLIGATLGQQIDRNILFKPKGREGPRLQELAVQTSSYGSQIPRIYGNMRVAGTVIWATDLKESKSSEGGGKGRPSTTVYSYSACFAVALSSREVKNIGRIWADGKIFRGSAGDFKTETGFRFYTGNEDQSVDPIIGAAEAIAPAHRGFAMAVFEDMDLTDYGNRIPSLTFEIIADDGSVNLADIMHDMTDGRLTGTHSQNLHGFAASGQNQRAALLAITESFSLSFSHLNGGVTFKSAETDLEPVQFVKLDDVAVNSNGRDINRPEFQTTPESKIPREISIRYYEPSRDYQSGMQTAFRPGQSRVIIDQDLPAAIDASSVKKLANDKLWEIYQDRSTARLNLVHNGQPSSPGAAVRLTMQGSSGLWRVRNWEFRNGAVELYLSRVLNQITISQETADEGRAIEQIDALAGQTRLALIDLPFAIDAPSQVTDVSQLYAVGAGEAGWRTAQLFAAGVGGTAMQLAGEFRGPGILGTAETILSASDTTHIDNANSIDVILHNPAMTLQDADTNMLLAGQNMAAVGSEIIQFGRAVPLGGNRYALSRLIRGIGGTEAETTDHQAGEDFILLEPGIMLEIGSQHYEAPQMAEFSALGRGDDEPVSATIATTGRALRPWSPTHPVHKFDAGGNLEISWTRRSRAGLLWADFVEVPLAEEMELYRVAISNISGQLLAAFEAESPAIEISDTQVQEFRDGGATEISAEIRQVGRISQSDPLAINIII